MHGHATPIYPCRFCGAVFESGKILRQHYEEHAPQTAFTTHQSALRKKCVIYRKTFNPMHPTLASCFNTNKKEMQDLLLFEVASRKSVKISIVYHAEFEKALVDNNDNDNDRDRVEICLRAPSRFVVNDGDVYRFMNNSQLIIQDRIDDFLENGSGWVLNGIRGLDIEFGNCGPLNGSCNKYCVKFTKELKKLPHPTKSTNCFLHAVAFHFVKEENVKKLNKFANKYFKVNISSPVSVKDIPIFESQNQHLKIKINVLYLDDESVYPILFSKNIHAKHHITLVLYKTEIGDEIISHYCYVTDVNKFLRKTYMTNKQSYDKSIRCLNCFSKFTSKDNAQQDLNEHYKKCLKNKPRETRVPNRGSTLQFKNYNNKFKSYYIGFFDFESCHKKPKHSCACEENAVCHHKTKVMAVQEPITVSFMILDWHGKIVMQETYSGKDCVKYFLNALLDAEEELLSTLNEFPDLNMSSDDELNFVNQNVCHICECNISNSEKVRDHCHVTGEFLGAAHPECNVNRREKKKIPMFCHNFTGYDGHFLLQHLGGDERITKLEGLPYNTEKFRTIQMNSFTFLDSLSFLNGSLNELMNDLVKNKDHKFKILRQQKLYNTHEQKELLLRKGVYPYEFVTSLKKLKRTKTLPQLSDFFSKLTNSNISLEDYNHAKNVFKKFGCVDMLDYTELYCKLDVGILAEVVSQFREIIYQNFGLDCW
jgi:hypothetical protein